MHYLIIGQDGQRKDEKIAALRQEILPDPDARKFDYDVLYARKLSAEDCKKALMALPAVAKKRLILIRDGEKLTEPLKDILLEFLESEQKTTVLVLEAAWTSREKFVQKIAGFVKVFEFEIKEGENIFAVTRMMAARRHAEAVMTLHKILLEEGSHPLQIMGGLVWFWGNKARERLSREQFEKGLLCLQEADLNIKRSKLSADYALEVLVVKLCLLLNG